LAIATLLLSGCITPATAQNCFPTRHIGRSALQRQDGAKADPSVSSQGPQVLVKSNLDVYQRFKSGGDLPVGSPPFAGYFFETPASLACVYSLVTPVAGCNPNTVSTNPTGGSQSIAIVEPYDDPYAGPDLAYFSAQFGLPFSTSQFQVVYEDGVPPPPDYLNEGLGELKEISEVEWAHAMAPNAKIYLVEAEADDLIDLMASVAIANNLIVCGHTTCTSGTGRGEVITSSFYSEESDETTCDQNFATSGVIYFSAEGDQFYQPALGTSPGVTYPCASPNTICVGGTGVTRNATTGAFVSESAWQVPAGGKSLYEARPAYQNPISSIVGSARGVPDVSFDGDPNTGLWVWDSFPYGGDSYPSWYVVGGISPGAAAWAGIVNAAGAFHSTNLIEETFMYNNRGNPADFTDITKGNCGVYLSTSAASGWDFCSGIGTPVGYGAK
jgi:subtilase family serine protease